VVEFQRHGQVALDKHFCRSSYYIYNRLLALSGLIIWSIQKG